MSNIPKIAYPSSSAPQGSGTGVTVNINPDITWQSGATMTWTTGAPIEWIGSVETVAEANTAGAGSTPRTVYTGASET